MNRQELLAVGLGLVLIFGVAGVANVTDSVSITERPYESHGEASGGNGATNATIPVVEAMRTAQNQTDGIAIEARLGQETNTNGSERPARIYEVSVVNGSGPPTVVVVSAENGTVLGTHPATNQSDAWRSLLGNQTDNATPSRQLNLDAVRSGPEAVRLARGESGMNNTVTEVRLESRNGTAVYNVRMVTETGGRSTVIVAAYPERGGVLSNASAETATATG